MNFQCLELSTLVHFFDIILQLFLFQKVVSDRDLFYKIWVWKSNSSEAYSIWYMDGIQCILIGCHTSLKVHGLKEGFAMVS